MCRLDSPDRQANGEGCAFSQTIAGGAHLAAMHLDEVSYDREPAPEAALRPRARSVRLPERIEHAGQKCLLDADARVGDIDLVDGPVARELYGDDASRWRELDRVRQQIPDHLLQAVGIADCRHRVAVQAAFD